MSSYFYGARTYGPLELNGKKGSVAYTITEKWVDLDRSQTARCGISTEFNCTLTAGMATTKLEEIRSNIEGSLGVKGIASIQSHIEESTQISTQFTVSQSVQNKFTCPAPACGSYVYSMYQLLREYDFVIKRNRLLRKPAITTHHVPEWTQRYDVRRETDEADPDCPCGAAEEQRGAEGDEIVILKIGKLSLRLDARRTQNGKVAFSLGKQIYESDVSHTAADIQLRELPAMFKALSGEHSGVVTASVELDPDFDLSLFETRSMQVLEPASR